MFHCYKHGWDSHTGSCPLCTNTTSNAIDVRYVNAAITCDNCADLERKLAIAVGALEKIAALDLCNHSSIARAALAEINGEGSDDLSYERKKTWKEKI